jgi:predicted nucleic-acid-binding protein
MLYDDTIYDLYEEEKLDFVDCISEYAKREYDEYMLKHCLNTFIPLKDALIEFVKFLKDNQVTEKESIIIGVIW